MNFINGNSEILFNSSIFPIDNKDDARKILLSKEYKENGKIKLNVQYENLGTQTINTVIYEGKSYKEIFQDSNKVWVDFITSDDISDSTTISDGVVVSSEEYDTPTKSLKCFGASSKYISKDINITTGHNLYVASKIKVNRYSQGQCGIELYNSGDYPDITQMSTTNGFITTSRIVKKNATTTKVYIGSFTSANADCYIDDIVIVDIDALFENVPSKDVMDSLYENYIKIIKGTQPTMISNETYVFDAKIEGSNEISDADAYTLGVQAINKKAQELLMTSATFYDGSGMSKSNAITVKDALRMGVAYMEYPILQKISAQPTYSFNAGNRTISMTNLQIDQSASIASDYPNYISKFGSLNDQQGNTIKNSVSIVEHNGVYFACAVLKVTNSGLDRHLAIKQLMDETVKKYEDSTYVIDESAISAYSACSIVLPKYPAMFENANYTYLVEKNVDFSTVPASITKMMTSMVCCDWVKDLDEKFMINDYDLKTFSGNVAPQVNIGDVMSFRDAIYLAMLPSQNITADALVKNIGKVIYKYNTQKIGE